MKILPIDIHFTYSSWWLLPIALAAIAGVYALYSSNRQSHFNRWQLCLLGSLRFLSIMLLGMGLLKPYFSYDKEIIQKPTIAILKDYSASMQGKDSLANIQLLEQLSHEIEKEIAKDITLATVPFHQSTPLSAENIAMDGNSTNIGKAIQYTYNKYSFHNLQAIVLISDGQHTAGLSPLAVAKQCNMPIFSVAFGDTNQFQGIIVQNLFYNEHSRQGSKFPIEIELQATGLEGTEINIALYNAGKCIAQQQQSIKKNKIAFTQHFMVEAKHKGLQKYELKLNVLNTKLDSVQETFYVNISPFEQHILLLGHHVHPDLNAIASALRSQDGRTVDVHTLPNIPQHIDHYQLIILHGLPSADIASTQLLQAIKKHKNNLWIFCTPSTYFAKLNELQNTWQFPNYVKNFKPQTAIFNTEFSLFHLPKATKNANIEPIWFAQMPLTNKKHSYPLLLDLKTKQTLVRFAFQDQQKLCLWQGYDLWKWRLQVFQKEDSHNTFNRLINSTADFLLSGKQQGLFQVQHKLIYKQSELANIKAHLMNANMEAINDADIEIYLQDSKNKAYTLAFSPQGKGVYSLDISHLPPEVYNYTAKVSNNAKQLQTKGHFAIQGDRKELQNKHANIVLLKEISQQTGGRLFYPSELQTLIKSLNEHPRIHSNLQYLEQVSPWIDIIWFLVSSLVCLSLEWLLRKFLGTY